MRKTAGLSPLAISLLHEIGPLPDMPDALAARIKAAALKVKGVAGLERAISTAGGVLWDGLDENLMAKNFPGLFIAGEMLDSSHHRRLSFDRLFQYWPRGGHCRGGMGGRGGAIAEPVELRNG